MENNDPADSERYYTPPDSMVNYNLPKVRQDHLHQFLQFIQYEVTVSTFLKNDICCILVDKYLLAMVYKYLMRTNIPPEFYSKEVFFLALNIALDVCEDSNRELTRTAYVWSTEYGTYNEPDILLQYREHMFLFYRALGWRTTVCKKWCDQLFSLAPENPAFNRNREEGHEGAHRHKLVFINGEYKFKRNYGTCSRCQYRE